MPLACKVCVMKFGIRGTGGLFANEEELFSHLEAFHHMPIKREGETSEQAIARFIEAHPEARDCPECKAAGAPWTWTEGKE